MELELNKVYKDRQGHQWKVILYRKGYLQPFTAINMAQDCSKSYTEDGFYCIQCHQSSDDLIELVGNEFTEDKKLRELKFIGYLGEEETLCAPNFSPNDCIDVILRKSCTSLQICSKNIKDCVLDKSTAKISKWEVTMKELPNLL